MFLMKVQGILLTNRYKVHFLQIYIIFERVWISNKRCFFYKSQHILWEILCRKNKEVEFCKMNRTS